MKSNLIEKYCFNHSEDENELQKKIREWTFKNERYPQMISGAMVGNILCMLIRSISAKKILEVGTFTGYSCIKMAQAIESCELHTCELMEKHAQTATNFIKKAKLDKNITVHQGPAIETLETFKINYFDCAFIDADKVNYLEYYKIIITLIRKGGLIVLDNMLWSGEVINPKDKNSIMLNKTAKFINDDDRVFNTLLPVRDGLMVCYKK